MENYSEVFTTNDAWKGGYYELLLCPLTDSTEATCSLLRAIWTFPSLDGCYLRRDREPAAQARVQPCENGMEGKLYGTITLPNQRVVPCATYTTETPKGNTAVFHWGGLILPLGGLSTAYPIGAFPFGSMEKVLEWKPIIDGFFTEVARWTNAKVPISIAVVGFEVNRLSDFSPDKISANGIPNERNEGILWNAGEDLKWYPATRP